MFYIQTDSIALRKLFQMPSKQNEISLNCENQVFAVKKLWIDQDYQNTRFYKDLHLHFNISTSKSNLFYRIQKLLTSLCNITLYSHTTQNVYMPWQSEN